MIMVVSDTLFRFKTFSFINEYISITLPFDLVISIHLLNSRFPTMNLPFVCYLFNQILS